MTRAKLYIAHEPRWEPADLRVDAAGNTKPGYRCVHQLENGNGQCGGNVFRLEQSIGSHGCIAFADYKRRNKPAPVKPSARVPGRQPHRRKGSR